MLSFTTLTRAGSVPGWRFEGEPFVVTTSDGAVLSGERHGFGPTVVLCHCWTGDRSIWEPVAARLAADHHVVVFDQRGHGRSTAGTTPPTIARLGQDLAQVIQELDLGAPTVAGHSLGGMGLLALADAAPDLLSAMVLVSTSAAPFGHHVPPPGMFLGLARFMADPTGDRLVQGRAGRLAARAALGFQPPRSAVDRTLATLRATAPPVRHTQMIEMAAFDLRHRLASITVPATVVVGRLDALTPPRHARLLSADLRHATLTVLPRAGHMLPLERADAVADLIAAAIPQPTPTPAHEATH